jgi:organic hydroperoxide reductase OsmC/OhrA
MTDSSSTAAEKTHLFTIRGTWSGDGTGCGMLQLPQGNLSMPIGGARELGGCGIGANPEEILLAAVGACFLNTWAIFLKKLDVPYADPVIRVSGALGPDPAGGYKMLGATIHAAVPRALLAERKPDVEKTLQLAEKYCIISKVAKAAMPVKVELEET